MNHSGSSCCGGTSLWCKIKEFFNGKSNKKKVLIIDDDPGLLMLVRKNLSAKGIAVYTANTGEAGLQMAVKHQPDLILLDVILPGIKGRQVCAKLKNEEVTKHIPIIFLTAKDSPDDVQAEIQLGAVSHITKPLNSKQLLEEVDKALSILSSDHVKKANQNKTVE